MDLKRIIEDIAARSRETFERKHGVLSFAEYLDLVMQRPYSLTRNAATYLRDLFEHFGSEEALAFGREVRRWRLFEGIGDDDRGRVFGQEEVQDRLYEILCEFVERGRADRFILLHGPNGSAKSSLADAIGAGLERYSRTDEGALFRFSWVFAETGDKGPVGFGSDEESVAAVESLARIEDRLVGARVPDELKDPPFFLLPKQRRRELLEQALQGAEAAESESMRWNEWVLRGDLSPKNKVIYETLLKSYRGDWRKVMRHVRVERYYISHRYRTGNVTIEPQGTIDASARMVGHGSMQGLPPMLAHETLHEAAGDLIDANAGFVEYSDFLKRNLEANKYLLTTAERGTLNLGAVSVRLNLVLCGTSNEKYLASFKRDPSFASFRGRFEFIRVPYLRESSKESLIYERHLARVAAGREVLPHLADLAALFVVLTRLKRPDPQRHDARIAAIVGRLTPLEKARLYDNGELPTHLGDEERKALASAVTALAREQDALEEEFEGYVDGAYEGRRGASPREMMALLTELCIESERAFVGPMDLFEALPSLIADQSLYGYLRLEADGGYHDAEAFLEALRAEYLRRLAKEIQRASDLIAETEYTRLFARYLEHVRAFATRQKVRNAQSGEAESPDEDFMEEVEGHLGVLREREDFRGQLMQRTAAFRLNHPEAPIALEQLFAEHLAALERSFFSERKERILALVGDALVVHGGGGKELVEERREAAKRLVQRLTADFGYGPSSAITILGWFQRNAEALEA